MQPNAWEPRRAIAANQRFLGGVIAAFDEPVLVGGAYEAVRRRVKEGIRPSPGDVEKVRCLTCQGQEILKRQDELAIHVRIPLNMADSNQSMASPIETLKLAPYMYAGNL